MTDIFRLPAFGVGPMWRKEIIAHRVRTLPEARRGVENHIATAIHRAWGGQRSTRGIIVGDRPIELNRCRED